MRLMRLTDEEKLLVFALTRRSWSPTRIAKKIGCEPSVITSLLVRPASSYAVPVPRTHDWKAQIVQLAAPQAVGPRA